MASKRRKKSREESRQAAVTTTSASNAQRVDDVRAIFEEQTHTPTVKTASLARAIANTPNQTAPASETTSTRTSPIGGHHTSMKAVYEKPATPVRPPLRTVVSARPYAAAKRVDLGAAEREKKTAWWLGPALIFGALLLLGLGWLDIQRSNVVAQPVGHPSATLEVMTRETRKKIAFYQKQLGHRLNANRVSVEVLNSRVAPPLEAAASPKIDNSMMRGVPLMQEHYVEQNYGAKNQQQIVSPDHPDARIQYRLQEEQLSEEFDRRAQQEYIREFVENARRDGVAVTLDEDANVIKVEPLRAGYGPNSGRTPGAYSPGTAR